MARHVHLALELTPRAPGAGGVLAGAVLLRIRGVTVLDWRLVGVDNSALALARAAAADHRAVVDEHEARRAEWPLFFCAESLRNQCGEVADFSVMHDGESVVLSAFFGCAVATNSRFEVPWPAFAGAVLKLGRLAVRRGAGTRPDLAPEDDELRRAWREELRERLRPLRLRQRASERAAARGSRVR